MATLQMGDTTFEKGDTETEKAPYFRGFGGYPELFKSCFPHQRIAQSAVRFFVQRKPPLRAGVQTTDKPLRSGTSAGVN